MEGKIGVMWLTLQGPLRWGTPAPRSGPRDHLAGRSSCQDLMGHRTRDNYYTRSFWRFSWAKFYISNVKQETITTEKASEAVGARCTHHTTWRARRWCLEKRTIQERALASGQASCWRGRQSSEPPRWALRWRSGRSRRSWAGCPESSMERAPLPETHNSEKDLQEGMPDGCLLRKRWASLNGWKWGSEDAVGPAEIWPWELPLAGCPWGLSVAWMGLGRLRLLGRWGWWCGSFRECWCGNFRGCWCGSFRASCEVVCQLGPNGPNRIDRSKQDR